MTSDPGDAPRDDRRIRGRPERRQKDTGTPRINPGATQNLGGRDPQQSPAGRPRLLPRRVMPSRGFGLLAGRLRAAPRATASNDNVANTRDERKNTDPRYDRVQRPRPGRRPVLSVAEIQVHVFLSIIEKRVAFLELVDRIGPRVFGGWHARPAGRLYTPDATVGGDTAIAHALVVLGKPAPQRRLQFDVPAAEGDTSELVPSVFHLDLGRSEGARLSVVKTFGS